MMWNRDPSPRFSSGRSGSRSAIRSEVDLHNAEGKLEQLIEEAAAGNDVVITRASGAAVQPAAPARSSCTSLMRKGAASRGVLLDDGQCTFKSVSVSHHNVCNSTCFLS